MTHKVLDIGKVLSNINELLFKNPILTSQQVTILDWIFNNTKSQVIILNSIVSIMTEAHQLDILMYKYMW